MLQYFITIFTVVIITSVLLLLVFNKTKQLSYRTVLAIALSSVLSGLLFPGLFNLISGSTPGMAGIPALLFITLSTLVLYIVLVLIFGILISFVVPEKLMKPAVNAAGDIQDGEAPPEENAKASVENASAETAGEENYLAQIYNNRIVENTTESANNEETGTVTENNLEISVDSEENIDKMGLGMEEAIDPISEGTPEEEGLKAAEDLSVNDCVDEAFRLKEQGDFEGAILYYMYALDRSPDKDLVFWIVLDICVLYKSLGQIDFARDILSGYVDSYSNVMDSSIRDEIERNLIYIQD